jgi:hypothetical protein
MLDVQLLHRCQLTAVGVGTKTVAGQSTDEPCVKAFVARKLPAEALPPTTMVPARIGAVRTDVEELAAPTSPPWLAGGPGDILGREIGNRDFHRPMIGGDSVANFRSPVGTLSCAVVDRTSDRLSLLSCNHVLASLNRGFAGDPILQPSFDDGGRIPTEVCGRLARYVPVQFQGWTSNIVDVAVADVPPGGLVAGVSGLGVPTGVHSGNDCAIGQTVYKIGRTTGLTAGTVAAVHVTGWITYPPILGGYGATLFKDQIVTTAMAGFGDSGSLLMDEGKNAIGVLFGGSSTHSFFCDIVHVQDQLAIEVVTSAS